MSQQDVQIAFQAGFVTYELEDYTEGGYDIRYERFADLIRADERNRAMRENAYVQFEREACAEVADSMDSLQDGAIGKAIRARGNT